MERMIGGFGVTAVGTLYKMADQRSVSLCELLEQALNAREKLGECRSSTSLQELTCRGTMAASQRTARYAYFSCAN